VGQGIIRSTPSQKFPSNPSEIRKKIGHSTTLAVALLWLGALTGGAGAQEPRPSTQPPPDETLVRIETELVQIDVLVEDREGRPVRGLKREDFLLLEDGKPQPLAHFAIGTAERPARWVTAGRGRRTNVEEASLPSSPSTPAVVEGRRIIFTIDDLHLSPSTLLVAKQTLRRFVLEKLGPQDEAALITTSGALGMVQQMTRERVILGRAIDRLSVQERTGTSTFDIPRLSPYHAELIDSNDPDALEVAVQELMASLQVDRRQATGMAQGRARQIVAENNAVTMATLTTIETTIRQLAALPGRKLMVLVSDGFLLGGMRDSRHFDLRRVTDAATRAGVTLYSLDARGLIAVPPEMDVTQPSGFAQILPGVRSRIAQTALEAQRDGLYALATDTGGKAFFHQNDLGISLAEMLAETESYYLLAFEPAESPRDGRYHKIEVRLPHHPSYRVRTRKGYLAPDEKRLQREAAERASLVAASRTSEKEARRLREMQIRLGLSSLVPIRELPIGITANFLKSAEVGTAIDLTGHIDLAALELKAERDRHRARLLLDTVIYTESGKVANNRSEALEINLRTSSLAQARQTGLAYRQLLQLPPGFYQIRTVLRQEGIFRIGSASTWIEVPDLSKKAITLSSIFITDSQRDGSIPDAKEGAPPVPVVEDVAAIVYRRFARKGHLEFLVFAYNAALGEKGIADAAIQTQVYAGNKLVIASPLNPFAAVERNSDLPYHARLSLESFEPGSYELRLVAIDRTTRQTTRRSLHFTVE
jgi:VWFA-related protein